MEVYLKIVEFISDTRFYWGIPVLLIVFFMVVREIVSIFNNADWEMDQYSDE